MAVIIGQSFPYALRSVVFPLADSFGHVCAFLNLHNSTVDTFGIASATFDLGGEKCL